MNAFKTTLCFGATVSVLSTSTLTAYAKEITKELNHTNQNTVHTVLNQNNLYRLTNNQYATYSVKSFDLIKAKNIVDATSNEKSWKFINGSWYYSDENGNQTIGLNIIDGQIYDFNASGAMLTGWQYVDEWYYFQGNGWAVRNAWIGNYYLGNDGKMLRNQWIGGYYVDGNGAWVPGAREWNWVKQGNIWKYQSSVTGQYLTNQWSLIGGKWYHFDADGNMQTGLHEIDGNKYFMNASGAMVTGWQYVDEWYYFQGNGSAVCNAWIGNYYLGNDGKMLRNQWIGGYYVDGNGAWVPGAREWNWVKQGNIWKYQSSVTGQYLTNQWSLIGDKWYHFDADGNMQTGFFDVDGATYYCDNSGAMVSNGWMGSNYFYPDGRLARDTWINGYYVNADGIWVPNATEWQWRQDGNRWMYKNTKNNAYAKNCWMDVSGSWYYFDQDGYMVTNTRVGNYFCGSDGRMATSNVIYGGYYYHINSSGVIVSCSRSLYGVDVSQWNGDVNLSQYQNGFVIIRAGYGWSTDQEDTYFRKNIAKCNAYGIPYGVYWYSYATDVNLAKQEANTFIQILRNSGANPTLGVWMDVESDPYKEARMTWNHASLDPIVKTFCDTIQSSGYRAGVYANYNDFENNISTGYLKWVAHWGETNDGTLQKDLSNYGAAIHQYTSRGIDKNIIYDMGYFD